MANTPTSQANPSGAAGFQIQNGTKTFVDSSGKAVADQNAASDFLYGNPAGTAAKASAPATTTITSPTSQYAVVTSKPATQDYNAIQSDYNTNIKPNLEKSATNTAQANNLPIIAGYNVSPTQTGNQGETKATNNATGQSYYITPQNQQTGVSAEHIQSILSGDQTPPTPAPSPTPSNPTFAQQAQAQTGTNATQENNQYQQQISQNNDEMTTAYNSFKNTVQNIMSGAFPLTSAQQSLVDATNSAFKQMNDQAQLKAAALSSETGGVANKVNATAGELTNITAQQAATVAKLQMGFQDQNYKMVTDSYNAFKDLENQKMASLEKLHTSIMDTYNKALDSIKSQAEFNETVFKDTQSLAQSKYEFRDLKDEMGNTVGTQVFDKSTGKPVSSSYNAGQTNPSTGVTTPTTVTKPDGTSNKESQYQTLQAVVPKPYQDLVWQIVNGKGDAPNTRTKYGMQLASWVAQVDPALADGSGGFDSTKYAARQTMQKSLASYTSGSYGQGVLSANKVVSHLASFLNSSSAIPGKGAVNILGTNKIGAELLGGASALLGNTQSQQTQAQAEQESRGLTDEMTKFFKGTGGTDVASIDSWSKGLDPYASQGSLNGSVQGTLSLFSGQLNSFIEQYKTVMGKEPDIGTILQPQTIQQLSAFKNAGYKVDLPGVYYTDKNAWQNNGGSQQQWNSAVDALTKNGIPLTQENILHAAQVINE